MRIFLDYGWYYLVFGTDSISAYPIGGSHEAHLWSHAIRVDNPSWVTGTCMEDLEVCEAVKAQPFAGIPMVVNHSLKENEFVLTTTCLDADQIYSAAWPCPVVPSCECGAEKTGCGGHSAWCPKSEVANGME